MFTATMECKYRQPLAALTRLLAALIGFAVPSSVTAESFQFTVDSSLFGETRSVEFELLLPDEGPAVRGLVFNLRGLCGNGLRSLGTPWVGAARAIDFGILTLDSGDLQTDNNASCLFGEPGTNEPRQLLEAALATAAAVSEQPQLENVPVGLIGFSQGGLNNLIIASGATDRVVSYSSLRGPTPPFTQSDEMKHVPGILISGGRDNVVSPTSIENGFETYRRQDAQVAYSVHWERGHDSAVLRGNGGQSWAA